MATVAIPETEKLIDLATAREMLGGVSRATFYRFIESANITTVRISPRVVRYIPSQIREIVAAGGVQRASEK